MQPPQDRARRRAASEIAAHPAWLEGLAAADLLEALANAPLDEAFDPMAIAPDDRCREVLARVLANEEAVDPDTLAADTGNALHRLERARLERRQRELRAMTAEAERRGDRDMLEKLDAETMQVNRALRTL